MTNHKSEPMLESCSAERAHAEQFKVRLIGERLGPAPRPSRPGTHEPRNDLSAEHKHRNGRCKNCDD